MRKSRLLTRKNWTNWRLKRSNWRSKSRKRKRNIGLSLNSGIRRLRRQKIGLVNYKRNSKKKNKKTELAN